MFMVFALQGENNNYRRRITLPRIKGHLIRVPVLSLQDCATPSGGCDKSRIKDFDCPS